MLTIVFRFVCYVCLYNHGFIVFIVIMYVIFNFHSLEHMQFYTATEQVLIELDISAIEDDLLLFS